MQRAEERTDMRLLRRICCGAAALVLCVSLLTSCGTDSVTMETESDAGMQNAEETAPAETDITEITTTAEVTETTADIAVESSGTEQPEAPDNTDEADSAYAAADRFLAACVSKDFDGIRDFSNIGKMLEEAAEQRSMTEDEIAESMGTAYDVFSTLDSYTLGEGHGEPELLAAYTEYVNNTQTEIEALIAEAAEDGMHGAEEMLLTLFQPLDGLYLFDYTSVIDGETQENTLYVVKQDGTWKVDCLILPMTVGMHDYVKAASVLSANTDAKSIFNAANTALVDMESEAVDATLLSGDYTFRGSDFENVSAPQSVTSEADALAMLKSNIIEFFETVTECEEFALTVENGVCTAVVVRKGTITDTVLGSVEQPVFGCYPHPLSRNELGTYQSLADVLAYAQA